MFFASRSSVGFRTLNRWNYKLLGNLLAVVAVLTTIMVDLTISEVHHLLYLNLRFWNPKALTLSPIWVLLMFSIRNKSNENFFLIYLTNWRLCEVSIVAVCFLQSSCQVSTCFWHLQWLFGHLFSVSHQSTYIQDLKMSKWLFMISWKLKRSNTQLHKHWIQNATINPNLHLLRHLPEY